MNNELSVSLNLDTNEYKSELDSALRQFNKFQRELSTKKLGFNKKQVVEFDRIFSDIRNTAIRELNGIQNKIDSLELKSDKLEASWDRALKNLDTSLPEEKWNAAMGKIDEIETRFNINTDELEDAYDEYEATLELLKQNPLNVEYFDDAFTKFNSELENVEEGLTRTGQKIDETSNKAGKLHGIFGRLSIGGRVLSQMRNSIATMLNPLNLVRKTWNDIIMADGSKLGETFRTVADNITKLLKPAIEWLAKAVLTVISYIAQMISIITGKKIDLFKKSKDSSEKIKNNFAGTSKAAKEINRQLAGFDEIQDISESTSGAGSGISGLQPVTQDIEFKFKVPELPKVLKDIAKWIKDNPKWAGILAGLTAFTLFGKSKIGTGILTAIKTILGGGSGANVTGLLGISSTLSLLTAAAWVITLDIIGIQEVIHLIGELNDAHANRDAAIQSNIENEKKLNKSLTETMISEDASTEAKKRAIDNFNLLTKGTRDYVEASVGGIKGQQAYRKSLEDSALTMNDAYKSGKLLESGEYEYYLMLKDQFNPMIEDNYKRIEITTGVSDELRESFKKLDKKYSTKYAVETNNNFTSFETSFKNMVGGVRTALGKPFSVKVETQLSTITDKVRNAISNIFIKSYDVGTNYVPNDQLAYIHQGEAIVPKKFNDKQFFTNYSSNDETNNLLEKLITAVNNIEINPYTTVKDVGNTAIQYIKDKSRQEGRSVI